MIYIKSKKIELLLKKIIRRHNVNQTLGKEVIKGLIWASMRGIDSHGINLFPQYIKEVISKRINIKPKIFIRKKTPSFLSMDADHTFGQYACSYGVNKAKKVSDKSGIAFINIYNSSHCGALSYFGSDILKNGYLVIGMTQATPRILLKNTSKVFYGNNPISLSCFISGNKNFVYDSCITTTSFNKIRNYEKNKKKIPLNFALDKNFRSTSNPSLAEYLLPMGDFKGTGLSLFVDLLTGGISNMFMSDDVTSMYGSNIANKRFLSQSFIVVNLKKITDYKIFKKNLKKLVNKIKKTKKINKKLNEPKYPGQIEYEKFIIRKKNGIPVNIKMVEEIKSLLN